ncbi:hypothetical protein H8N00_25950, partial [Streptomyces sp. AC563]|nr:hypothetical protein [Streptomyces buecherae]
MHGAHGTPDTDQQGRPAPQPSIGSIAAHRPHAVGAPPVRDLEPDIDADLDAYEAQDGHELPQGRFLD